MRHLFRKTTAQEVTLRDRNSLKRALLDLRESLCFVGFCVASFGEWKRMSLW